MKYLVITDVNECQLSDITCSDTCINTAKEFFCTCPVGKILDVDKMTCIGKLLLLKKSCKSN